MNNEEIDAQAFSTLSAALWNEYQKFATWSSCLSLEITSPKQKSLTNLTIAASIGKLRTQRVEGLLCSQPKDFLPTVRALVSHTIDRYNKIAASATTEQTTEKDFLPLAKDFLTESTSFPKPLRRYQFLDTLSEFDRAMLEKMLAEFAEWLRRKDDELTEELPRPDQATASLSNSEPVKTP